MDAGFPVALEIDAPAGGDGRRVVAGVNGGQAGEVFGRDVGVLGRQGLDHRCILASRRCPVLKLKICLSRYSAGWPARLANLSLIPRPSARGTGAALLDQPLGRLGIGVGVFRQGARRSAEQREEKTGRPPVTPAPGAPQGSPEDSGIAWQWVRSCASPVTRLRLACPKIVSGAGEGRQAPAGEARRAPSETAGALFFDQGVGGVVVDRFEVFRFDHVGVDARLGVEAGTHDVADHVLDELGVVM